MHFWIKLKINICSHICICFQAWSNVKTMSSCNIRHTKIISTKVQLYFCISLGIGTSSYLGLFSLRKFGFSASDGPDELLHHFYVQHDRIHDALPRFDISWKRNKNPCNSKPYRTVQAKRCFPVGFHAFIRPFRLSFVQTQGNALFVENFLIDVLLHCRLCTSWVKGGQQTTLRI